jgi:hypothetical protein
VGIDEFGRTGFGFADAGADLGEGEFETFGFGGGRSVEVVLDVAGLDGIDAKGKSGDGGSGWMGFEIELEEAPERAVIAGGDGKLEGAKVRIGAFEDQVEADLGSGHGLAMEALAEILEVAGEEEGEGFEVVEGMFEIEMSGVIGAGGSEVEGALPFAASEFLQEGGIRAEAFGQAVFRQPTELLERPDTPLRQHRLGVGAERQYREREHAEPAGFLAGLH